MAGWDTPEPDSNYPEFAEIYSVIQPLFVAGERKFLVGDLDGKFVFKLSGELIQKTLNVIKSEIPPTGLVTYAEEKAMETLFDFDPSLNFSTAHTRNGEERELECMEKLSEATGLEFLHTGDNQVHIHASEVGCTPDGVIFDELDLVQTGAEVKCKSPLEHARNLLINTNQDLMDAAFDHFVQIQTAMLVTGTDYWYFANYNPYAKRKDMQFKHIIIYRDDAFIKILKKRIEIAKKIKADFLSKFHIDEVRKAA
ncbi:MAG: hypothetical protein Tp185DCM00d2C31949971_3 [Prokaryotic dsDNA virus sp.]|nr:MAG: hypothetical protein Tp185DCM00d2C31949971_3 [Prokaryotic dsDNA virus sp.]QDP61778.1 MAG: hypothetical protein Tp1111MES1053591_17 [Prokaryotic dsDNA virus sp.]